MKLPRVLLFLLLAAGSGHTLFAQAVIEGRVALSAKPAAPVMNRRYGIISSGGILSPNPPVAVVYLEGNFPPVVASPQQVVQKNMTFVPSLLPVRTGTRVEFPNDDDTYHNIFSFSPAKRFDLGRYRPDERPIPSVQFDVPGLVVLRCDIHEHMRGLVLVLDTPYFMVTDTAGHYRLEGLPAGHYMLKVWLDSQTTLSRPVEVRDGTVLHQDFP